MKRLARIPLLFHPGEKWEYGMSTDVLGRVVEVVTDMPLDRLFDDRIFRPLGMKDTTFKVSAEQKKRLVEKITGAFIDIGVPGEAVQVILKDNPKHNWGIAGKLASEG